MAIQGKAGEHALEYGLVIFDHRYRHPVLFTLHLFNLGLGDNRITNQDRLRNLTSAAPSTTFGWLTAIMAA
jgi:hypothetical protein